MKRLIIIIIGVLLAGCVSFLIISSHRSPPSSSNISTLQPSNLPTSSPSALLNQYSDPSGFSFQYPKTLVLKEKEKPNNQIYSSLELSSVDKPNTTITVKVEDSSLQKIDDWFKNKKSSIFGEIKKIKLADLDARQFDANNLHSTIALDQGVLFNISTNAKKGDELTKAYDQIVSSFAFIQPSTTDSGANSGGGSSDIIDEGEEVVE